MVFRICKDLFQVSFDLFSFCFSFSSQMWSLGCQCQKFLLLFHFQVQGCSLLLTLDNYCWLIYRTYPSFFSVLFNFCIVYPVSVFLCNIGYQCQRLHMVPQLLKFELFRKNLQQKFIVSRFSEAFLISFRFSRFLIFSYRLSTYLECLLLVSLIPYAN